MAANHPKGQRNMWVVLLEILFALGLAAFIVWWTWPKKDAGKDDRDDAGQ